MAKHEKKIPWFVAIPIAKNQSKPNKLPSWR
jgi:hypothetical protein